MNNNFKVLVLGNSSAQTDSHETASFLIYSGKDVILLDCGPGIVKSLIKAHVRLSSITTIIITHCHADHTAGYPYLLFNMDIERSFIKQELPPVKVIALQDVYEGLEKTVKIQYPIEGLTEKIVSPCLVDESTISLITSTVETFLTVHSVPTIGVSILNGNKKITFSGDSIYTDAIVHRAEGANLLFQDAFCTENMSQIAKIAMHATSIEAGIIAKESNVQTVAIYHPLAKMWENPKPLIEEIKQNYSGKVIMPQEGDILEV